MSDCATGTGVVVVAWRVKGTVVPQRLTYLISYDIAATRRRNRVLDLLRNYGMPVQRSVVECELTGNELDSLRAQLLRLIYPRDDQVRIYMLCQSCLARSERHGAEFPGKTGARRRVPM